MGMTSVVPCSRRAAPGMDDASQVLGATSSTAALISALALCAAAAFLYLSLRPRKRRRAGCAPLRVSPSGRMSILLVQSRKHPGFWTFPAGGVERGEREEQAAARETREEAGVTGKLGRRICRVSDEKSKTCMYALYVEHEMETWDEAGDRQRRWFDLGVPGSPSAVQCFAYVRKIVIDKPSQQQCLHACERLRADLAREGERLETSWGPPPKRRSPSSPTKT